MVANTPGGKGTAIIIEEAKDTLCAVEKLAHLEDAKSLTELLPDIRAQSIAVHATNLMDFVLGRRRRCEQIPSRLANVNENRRFRLSHILPKVANAEFGA
jgi:hypothetical protein